MAVLPVMHVVLAGLVKIVQMMMDGFTVMVVADVLARVEMPAGTLVVMVPVIVVILYVLVKEDV